MNNPNVAETILQQLGGNRFVMMTGSKNFISNGNSLIMTLTKNMSKANRLTVELKWDDTYTMTFAKVSNGKINNKTFEWVEPKNVEVKVIENVYFDMLQDLFTNVTGLYTRL